MATLVSPVVNMTVPAEPEANGDRGPDAAAVGRIRTLVLRQQQQLSDRRPWDLDAEVAQLRADRQLLEEHREAASRSVRDLSTEASERETELADAKVALLELEDRRTLRSLLDAIVAHVEAAKWVDLADTVLRSFQGLLPAA